MERSGKRKDGLEMSKSTEKKFVRYKEGAEMYSISQSLFERLAKASGACYKIGRAVIVVDMNLKNIWKAIKCLRNILNRSDN